MDMLLNRLVKRDSTQPACSSDHATFLFCYLSATYLPPKTPPLSFEQTFAQTALIYRKGLHMQ